MRVLKKGAWVLVADSDKALILENHGTAKQPQLSVRRKKTQENPPDREQSADRPGRMKDGPGVQRSAMDDTDWHQLEKTRFAIDVAALLSREMRHESVDSLVLVAGARLLGDIREKLDPEARDKVVAEIPKILTKHPVNQIARNVLDSLDELN